MAKFQVTATLTVEADDDSEAWSIADAALDHLVWPGESILRCTVGEVKELEAE
jgi:hypothetical protein